MDSDGINVFEIYKEEIAQIERLTPGEREAAFLNSMAGDVSAQKTLANDFLPDVVDISRLYLDQGVPVEELVSQGNEALVEGVKLLAPFSDREEAESALVRMIMNAMEDLIEEEGRERESAGKIADQVNEVADAATAYFEETGRDADMAALAEKTGFDESYIRDAQRMSGNRIAHLEKTDGSAS
ncbi:MAG: hypothetical protein K6E33_08865 [Lachnospiraceae bacterium]|nr:hypothetical protein [Lachnospiraceae bacterium]